MRPALAALLIALAAFSVRAEDFTGFYAGINAGYARGHERDRITRPSRGAKITSTITRFSAIRAQMICAG